MMTENYYFYLLIFLFWNWAVVQAAEDTLLLARVGPAASLLHNKIYFFGGTPFANIQK
jgi:hypothetical protein